MMSEKSASLSWAVRMADSMISQHPAITTKWAYEWGLLMKAILGVWQLTGEWRYFDYVKSNVDRFVEPDGSIRTYRPDEYNIDHINPGKLLFPLYRATGDEQYKQAATRLKQQLDTHPRTADGGFWHKQIYPHQMWLDGIYMASPFLAEFAASFGHPAIFDDVVHQITLIERHTYDPQTGLLYHGWDETKSQRWADPQTGHSQQFWGRALGWYVMALCDVLDYLPKAHSGRASLIDILRRTVAAVLAVQDPASGVWYQVLDAGQRPGNYLEASASCMFVYGISKGIRQGYLEADLSDRVQQAYQGILDQFVEVDDAGLAHVRQICSVAGLGGTPYRAGTFDYYISEPVVADDFKGVGPFILASLEVHALHR